MKVKSKKVTLVWPLTIHRLDYRTPSYTMALLSKILEREGFKVSVIDTNLLFSPREFNDDFYSTMNKLIELVEKTRPSVIGIGEWSLSIPFINEFTRLFKEKNSDIPIILGGRSATFVPEETLRLMPQVDFLVRGEGYLTLPELVNGIPDSFSKDAKASVKDIKGISFVDKDEIVNTPDRIPIKDLDELPFIDYENFILPEKIRLNHTALFFSQGCNFNCTFCCVNRKNRHYPLRFHSIQYVLDQIQYLKSMYESPNDYIEFYDDNICSNPKMLRELAIELKENFPSFKWSCMMRIESMKEELIKDLRENNLQRMRVGVESILEKNLIFYNKTKNPVQHIYQSFNAMSILEKNKIEGWVALVIGSPTETKEDFDTIRGFAEIVKTKFKYLDTNIHYLILFPGTQLWERYKQGEIEMFKARSNHYFPNNVDNLKIAEKYSDLIWALPNWYRIRNEKMSDTDYENLLIRYFSDIA